LGKQVKVGCLQLGAPATLQRMPKNSAKDVCMYRMIRRINSQQRRI